MSTQAGTNRRKKRGLIAALVLVALALVAAGLVWALDRPRGLHVTPSSIDFGEHHVGRPSVAQTVKVTNGGGQSIRRIDLEGSDAGDFHVTDASTCDIGPLPEGKSCTLVVRFTPTETGDRMASVFVSGISSGPGVQLAGTGVER